MNMERVIYFDKRVHKVVKETPVKFVVDCGNWPWDIYKKSGKIVCKSITTGKFISLGSI